MVFKAVQKMHFLRGAMRWVCVAILPSSMAIRMTFRSTRERVRFMRAFGKHEIVWFCFMFSMFSYEFCCFCSEFFVVNMNERVLKAFLWCFGCFGRVFFLWH